MTRKRARYRSPIESYVVRIYRRPAGKGRPVVGIVEADALNSKGAFTNVEELWEILAMPRARR